MNNYNYGNLLAFLRERLNPQYKSVLTAGFILSPDGDYFLIKDDDAHTDVINYCLNYIYKNKTFVHYDQFEGIRALTQLNYIVYMGIKTVDSRRAVSSGLGLFCFPENYATTEVQEQIIYEVLNTNYSKITSKAIFDLKFNQFSTKDAANEISEEEFYNIRNLNNTKKR